MSVILARAVVIFRSCKRGTENHWLLWHCLFNSIARTMKLLLYCSCMHWLVCYRQAKAWPSSFRVAHFLRRKIGMARNVTAWPASRPGYEIHGNSAKIDQKSHSGRGWCGWTCLGPCCWAFPQWWASEKTMKKKKKKIIVGEGKVPESLDEGMRTSSCVPKTRLHNFFQNTMCSCVVEVQHDERIHVLPTSPFSHHFEILANLTPQLFSVCCFHSPRRKMHKRHAPNRSRTATITRAVLVQDLHFRWSRHDRRKDWQERLCQDAAW